MTEVRTHRDTLRKESPPWLATGWAEKFMYPFGAVLDGITDALIAGVQMRFPGFYSAESLPILGRDRRIRRGLVESDLAYTVRLIGWRDAHRHKASALELLSELRGYLSPYTPKLAVVQNDGRRYTLAAAGSFTVDDIPWNWDGDATQITRYWVLIYVPNGLWTTEEHWGDPGTWGDGGTWGSSATAEEVTSIRTLVAAWNPPHAWCAGVIPIFDETAWNASQPDGTWDRQERRNSAAIYWDGCRQ